jgi:16S rRNA (guanine527-N7)-methyltransferase
MKTLLKTACPQLDDAARERMAAYWDMLLVWNERVNLTAITDPAEAAKKHFADSLTALPFIPEGARCIDVGTGAGFPGIPLMIARPDIQMTLLDSLNKRVRFLEAVSQELGLNARCLHARAEDAGRDKAQRESYDIALSRAVAPLPVLLELTVPFLKIGGTGIAYKTDAAEELRLSARALALLHCRARVEAIEADYGQRTLVLATKQAACPPAYPRRAGLPERTPL